MVEVVAPLGGYLSSREAPDLSTSGWGLLRFFAKVLMPTICRVTSAPGTVRVSAADTPAKPCDAINHGRPQPNAHCEEATRPWHGRFAPIPATAVARIWWPPLSDSGRARACCVDSRTAHFWQKRFGAARRAELSFVVGGS
jgi:hypothetical protein